MNEPQPRPKGSLLATAKAVLWGFLGVRRGADYQKDIARLNPLHVVAVGIVMAFLFVLVLILIVRWVAT
jgi:EamA domain-containing membrane protein RarD